MIDSEELKRRLVSHFAAGGPAGVVAVYLFGSHAEGRVHRESDVDVGVLVDRRLYPTAKARFELRVRLTSDLIAALHHNDVDLVVVNDAPPLFARRIALDGERLVCADAEAERAFRRDVQLRAADLAPFLERMRRIKLASLAR
jgi:predicted nucleotidyltransferase